MKPGRRCKMKEDANVVLIEDDDYDVIVVDSPESSHLKQGGSSEQRENRRVSPQSVIRIEDDDESHTNHFSAQDEEGFAEFESDATSSHGRTDCSGKYTYTGKYLNKNCYHFGDDEYEYEPFEIDSDCEVMEDSSGKLREQWEKAASQRKVHGLANFDTEGLGSAPVGNTRAGRQKNTTDPFSDGRSCSNANAPFTGTKYPFAYNVVNEENCMFPEFDWCNLGGRSSSKKPNSSNTGEVFRDKSTKTFYEFFSVNLPSQNNVFRHSFGSDRRGVKGQAKTLETEGTSCGKGSSDSQPGHKMNINQTDCNIDHERNPSCSRGEQFHAEYVECDCVFPSDCECGRSRDLSVKKVHTEEQIPSHMPCKAKSNNNKTPSRSSVGTDCEAGYKAIGSKEKDVELDKISSSETVVKQDGYPKSMEPAVETDAKYVPGHDSNDIPFAEGNFGSDIINDKEKLKELKETLEYKRAMEEEWASRQQQLKLQAEEAQKLRRRKRAEILRVSNMERRQQQRLEEVRESQKQDSANLNLKEQYRSEIINELKVLELRCFDMTSLLRSLGVQVEGGANPSPQQVHGAYKRALLKFHPDRTSGSSLKQQVEAEEKFKLISRMKEKFKLP